LRRSSNGIGHDRNMKGQQPPGRDPATWVARLTTDEQTALRIHAVVCETANDGSVAASVAEEAQGCWSVALHFRGRPQEEAVRALIGLVAGGSAAEKLAFELIAPTDWVRKSQEGLSPVQAGRFVVHGSHHRGHFAPNPGLAFGTGQHASTLGCLLALDTFAKHDTRQRQIGSRRARRNKAAVLDVGTGSGVLAIAAAKAVRRPIVAGDMDARATAVARANTRLNGVLAEVEIVRAAGLADQRFLKRSPYRLILANIVLAPLRELATPIARFLAPRGCIVLSGLLAAQGRPALASYRTRGPVLRRRIMLGGWITLVLERPSRGRKRRMDRALRRTRR
jgi:ribosomal protein L11 methyltransferase